MSKEKKWTGCEDLRRYDEEVAAEIMRLGKWIKIIADRLTDVDVQTTDEENNLARQIVAMRDRVDALEKKAEANLDVHAVVTAEWQKIDARLKRVEQAVSSLAKANARNVSGSGTKQYYLDITARVEHSGEDNRHPLRFKHDPETPTNAADVGISAGEPLFSRADIEDMDERSGLSAFRAEAKAEAEERRRAERDDREHFAIKIRLSKIAGALVKLLKVELAPEADFERDQAILSQALESVLRARADLPIPADELSTKSVPEQVREARGEWAEPFGPFNGWGACSNCGNDEGTVVRAGIEQCDRCGFPVPLQPPNKARSETAINPTCIECNTQIGDELRPCADNCPERHKPGSLFRSSRGMEDRARIWHGPPVEPPEPVKGEMIVGVDYGVPGGDRSAVTKMVRCGKCGSFNVVDWKITDPTDETTDAEESEETPVSKSHGRYTDCEITDCEGCRGPAPFVNCRLHEQGKTPPWHGTDQ